MSEPLLRLVNVCKAFGPVRVIEDVSVDVHPGRVTVLLGENGAGKSTLIKMMSGIYQPDAGEIHVAGEKVSLPDVKAAERLGIATIHQELNLVPTMSVAQNISLGREPRRFGVVDRKELARTAREAMARIGMNLDPAANLGEMGVARQQLVEVAKALSLDARILILDEPTAALTGAESAALFAVMDELKARGVGMVFISHHLDELARVGDTVVVLRDGHVVTEVPASTSEDELIRLMVGRQLSEQFPRRPRRRDADAEELLRVEGVSTGGLVQDASFSVHRGEVVGLAGLVGAGRTELVRAIAGAEKRTGSVTLCGEELPANDAGAAVRAGIGHVPEDRKHQGLVLDAPVKHNIGYATLGRTAKAGLVDRAGQRRRARDVAQKLRVRMRDVDQHVRDLSGGNQQKVVFARWVVAGSTVLLLDEPTRGVDVGAKVEIYELVRDVTDAGGAVVLVSSELPEVLGMSDRILVMSEGRITGELEAQEATEDAVMALAVSNSHSDASAERAIDTLERETRERA